MIKLMSETPPGHTPQLSTVDGRGTVEVGTADSSNSNNENNNDNDRNIFVKPSQYDKNFPEVYTSQGEEISYITTEAVKDGVSKGAEKAIPKIAIAKIEKGNMGANTGNIYGSTTAQGTQRQVSTKEVFTNEGEKITLKIGKNFTKQTKAGKTITTKGISQYDFFMENGWVVKILKPLQHLPFIGDLFDVANFAMGVHDGKPTPIPMGGLEVMADYLIKDTQAFMEQKIYNDMQIAKEKGLDEVKKEVGKYEHLRNSNPYVKQTLYYTLPISSSTAQDILSGKIVNWKDVNPEPNGSITLLYLRKPTEKPNQYTFIIETFFVHQ